MRPFGELDFGDQLGFHPMHAACGFRRAREGALVGLEFLQAPPHVGMAAFIESAAGLTDRNKPAFAVIQAQHNGAKVLARAPGIGVAANDALLSLGDLDFQPLTAALLDVAALAALGDNAFKTLLLCGFQQRRTLRRSMPAK